MRRFFKTIVKVTVLTEDYPPEFDDLHELAHTIDQGDASGSYTVSTEKISAVTAAKGLRAQGSDPEFFQLDSNGKDISDE